MKGEYYRMDFNAWDEGTVELPLEQEAAYLRLCHQMYRMSGPIPNSPKLLRSIFRCGHNKAQALLRKLIAAKKITLNDDGFLNQTRVSRELQARQELAIARGISGRTGGLVSGVRRGGDSSKNIESPSSLHRVSIESPSSLTEVTRRNPLNGHDPPEPIADALRSRREERRGEEKESSLRSPKKAENEHGPPNRGSRLDAAWQPSSSDTEFAAEFGWEPARIAMTVDRFRDYWLSSAGKAAVKRDWSAAWRNWVRKDVEDRNLNEPKPLRRDPYGRNY